MSIKYKLIGLTEKAFNYLPDNEVRDLYMMIDDYIEYVNTKLFRLSDGELCHKDFLIIETIKN